MLTVYSKAQCPYCDQAKALLNSRGIQFEEIRVDLDPSAKDFLVERGHRTVPQIYQNGELFVEGGVKGLSALTESQFKEKLID